MTEPARAPAEAVAAEQGRDSGHRQSVACYQGFGEAVLLGGGGPPAAYRVLVNDVVVDAAGDVQAFNAGRE